MHYEQTSGETNEYAVITPKQPTKEQIDSEKKRRGEYVSDPSGSPDNTNEVGGESSGENSSAE